MYIYIHMYKRFLNSPEVWTQLRPFKNLMGPLGRWNVLPSFFGGQAKALFSGTRVLLNLPQTNSKSTWKWMVGIRSFPFGDWMPICRDVLVSFREDKLQESKNHLQLKMSFSTRWVEVDHQITSYFNHGNLRGPSQCHSTPHKSSVIKRLWEGYGGS